MKFVIKPDMIEFWTLKGDVWSWPNNAVTINVVLIIANANNLKTALFDDCQIFTKVY